MEKQVFVVTTGTPDGDDISIHGVYTSMERAKDAKDLIEGLNRGICAWIDDFYIE